MLSRENNKGTDETYIFGELNLLNSAKICYWGKKVRNSTLNLSLVTLKTAYF